jgi:hypothetical protein
MGRDPAPRPGAFATIIDAPILLIDLENKGNNKVVVMMLFNSRNI